MILSAHRLSGPLILIVIDLCTLSFQYAQELALYIKVDIYGECGDKSCDRTKPESCFKMLKNKYKFYLAFENSNCQYYITEKLFINALR